MCTLHRLCSVLPSVCGYPIDNYYAQPMYYSCPVPRSSVFVLCPRCSYVMRETLLISLKVFCCSPQTTVYRTVVLSLPAHQNACLSTISLTSKCPHRQNQDSDRPRNPVSACEAKYGVSADTGPSPVPRRCSRRSDDKVSYCIDVHSSSRQLWSSTLQLEWNISVLCSPCARGRRGFRAWLRTSVALPSSRVVRNC